MLQKKRKKKKKKKKKKGSRVPKNRECQRTLSARHRRARGSHRVLRGSCAGDHRHRRTFERWTRKKHGPDACRYPAYCPVCLRRCCCAACPERWGRNWRCRWRSGSWVCTAPSYRGGLLRNRRHWRTGAPSTRWLRPAPSAGRLMCTAGRSDPPLPQTD